MGIDLLVPLICGGLLVVPLCIGRMSFWNDLKCFFAGHILYPKDRLDFGWWKCSRCGKAVRLGRE